MDRILWVIFFLGAFIFLMLISFYPDDFFSKKAVAFVFVTGIGCLFAFILALDHDLTRKSSILEETLISSKIRPFAKTLDEGNKLVIFAFDKDSQIIRYRISLLMSSRLLEFLEKIPHVGELPAMDVATSPFVFKNHNIPGDIYKQCLDLAADDDGLEKKVPDSKA